MALEITDAGATGLVVRSSPRTGLPSRTPRCACSTDGRAVGLAEGFSVRPKKDGAWVVVPKKDAAQRR